jgi:predicted metal-dependent phosphotriesterase family hydrolase
VTRRQADAGDAARGDTIVDPTVLGLGRDISLAQRVASPRRYFGAES